MASYIPEYPIAFWFSASIAVILIGIAKAGFAGGVSVLAIPLVSLTISVPEAAALLLPLLILTDILAFFYYRRDFDRRCIKILLPGAMIGISAGGMLFSFFIGKDYILKMCIGILAVLFVLFQISRMYIMGIMEKHRPHSLEGLLMGAFSGFTSTIAHAGGPPLAMFLLPQKMPKDLYVGTTAVFFAVTNVLKLIPYSILGILKVGNIATIALLSPLCYVGVRLGVYLNRHFTERWFNVLIYTILFISGIQLIWVGISHL
ncbi:MAG: sulfite exporter TauE/SafE family protein [Syntrophorhabdaceae bacterium]|nr:sulfite exporter TauE/SafE family protein [Syntrophorhabdaceae bacterium]